jgi:hypothetical protein
MLAPIFWLNREYRFRLRHSAKETGVPRKNANLNEDAIRSYPQELRRTLPRDTTL